MIYIYVHIYTSFIPTLFHFKTKFDSINFCKYVSKYTSRLPSCFFEKIY